MGVDLREADLAGFARLRIPPELLAEAGVCRVTDAEARDVYGILGSGDMSGIAFPYFAPEALMRGERRRNYVRIRRDRLEVEDGKGRRSTLPLTVTASICTSRPLLSFSRTYPYPLFLWRPGTRRTYGLVRPHWQKVLTIGNGWVLGLERQSWDKRNRKWRPRP